MKDTAYRVKTVSTSQGIWTGYKIIQVAEVKVGHEYKLHKKSKYITPLFSSEKLRCDTILNSECSRKLKRIRDIIVIANHLSLSADELVKRCL